MKVVYLEGTLQKFAGNEQERGSGGKMLGHRENNYCGKIEFGFSGKPEKQV